MEARGRGGWVVLAVIREHCGEVTLGHKVSLVRRPEIQEVEADAEGTGMRFTEVNAAREEGILQIGSEVPLQY